MFVYRTIWSLGLTAMAAMLLAVPAQAERRSALTTISIKGMHCQFCAKKVVVYLQKIPGVVEAQVDAKKGTALVKCGSKLPSPKAQWEAVEKAGFKPLRLAGPYGVFTKKPRV